MLRRQSYQSCPAPILAWLLLLLQSCRLLQAEIGHSTLAGNGNRVAEMEAAMAMATPRCAQHKYHSMVRAIDDVEDLDLDVPIHIALDQRQKKRFVLQLNNSTPLTIRFSAPVARKMYYNQTANILRPAAVSTATAGGSLVLPCALRGQYDLFVQARLRGSLKIEAHAGHPQQTWPLLNRTHRISIRTQNRVRKRQLIVKWERSKFDYHAMHYCLVVSSRSTSFGSFCEALYAYALQQQRQRPPLAKSSICSRSSGGASLPELVWARPAERARRLDPRHSLHIVCTGARTQQLLRGLMPNNSYQLEVYGVHQRRQNLTFQLAHTLVHFNRTHPTALRQQQLSLLKIGGLQGVQVYSFKVPPAAPYIRYLLLPCSGSEIRLKLLRQRRVVRSVDGIYRPTYIKLVEVQPGERYLMRFEPSNVDETLRAQKVRMAVTSERLFRELPELPENITVFEVRTRCTATTIAWHGSPDERPLSYCVIVFNLPQRNRSAVDYTNYCMDFGAQRLAQHKHFSYIRCRDQQHSGGDRLETETILSRTPGASYLIYVTANLSMGKPLPYQTLTVHMGSQCADSSQESHESHESHEQLAYY